MSLPSNTTEPPSEFEKVVEPFIGYAIEPKQQGKFFYFKRF
jgi:hypothetical protein